MAVVVDTSVWSLALRRDHPAVVREVALLGAWIEKGEEIVLTGSILQEILQGFASATRTQRLLASLAPFPLLPMVRDDYVFAAEVRNRCRAKGIQVTTVDAQIAAAAMQHGCELLTVDDDFRGIARHFPLRLA